MDILVSTSEDEIGLLLPLDARFSAFTFSGMWAIYEPSLMHLLSVANGMSIEELNEMSARSKSGSANAEDEKPYDIVDGIAYIGLTGVLTKRDSCWSMMMGSGSSTTRLRMALRAADRDPDVKSKMVVIDSPGGDVSGTFEAANDLMNGTKPTDVYCDDMCASGAMAIAAGARSIYNNSSAMLGSVGVYTRMQDTSEAQKLQGRSIHVVKAGKYKALGEDGKITPEVLLHVQKDVDTMHGIFVKHVLKGRPNLSKDQLADIADAGIYIGKDAVKIGLSDGVLTQDQAHRKALKANAEGTTKSMAVSDEQLRNFLAADSPATQANIPASDPPEQPEVPNASASAPAYNIDNSRMLLHLSEIGVNSPSDLRKLAAEALTGRTELKAASDRAIKLATALYADNPDMVASFTETFANGASLGFLRAQSIMLEDGLRAAGLAAPEGVAFTPRHSTPPQVGTVPANAEAVSATAKPLTAEAREAMKVAETKVATKSALAFANLQNNGKAAN
jgi:signal peptide peptidase SppA